MTHPRLVRAIRYDARITDQPSDVGAADTSPMGTPVPACGPAVGLVAPLPPQVGGVASFAEWLLAHQDAIGCTFVAFDLERPPGEEAGGRFRPAAIARQAALTARFVRWLVRAPRVVHVCVSYTTTGLLRDLVLVALLRASGRRAIAHVHGGSLAPGDRSPRVRLVRLVSRLAARTVTIGPSSAAALASLGVDAGWVMNPVRIAPGNDAAPERGDGGTVSVLFAGTYGDRKGTPDLLHALGRMRDAGTDVELRLAGKEEYRGEEASLRVLAGRLGLRDAVRFEGVAAPDRLAHLYAEADVFCLPSHRDGLPMALLEAAAFGVPVVATPVGGIPDVVDAGTGLLVPPGDVEALADALVRLAADPELRRRLGDAGRARAQKLAAPDVLAARWRSVYEEQGLDLRPAP